MQLLFKVLGHSYLACCAVPTTLLSHLEASCRNCFCVQLVQDLRTLRALAEYLLRFDAVTFLMYLENLRATEGVTSVWLFHDAAHTIFEQVCCA